MKKERKPAKKDRKPARCPSWSFIFSKAGLAVVIAAATLFLMWGVRKNSTFATERVRPFAEKTLGVMSKWFTFTEISVAELLLYLLILLGLVTVIAGPFMLLSKKHVLRRFLSWLATIMLLASLAFLMFEGLYGCSYHASSKLDALGLEVRERSHEELLEMTEWLITEAENTRPEAGFMTAVPSHETFALDAENVARIASAYTGTEQTAPKRVSLSK